MGISLNNIYFEGGNILINYLVAKDLNITNLYINGSI